LAFGLAFVTALTFGLAFVTALTFASFLAFETDLGFVIVSANSEFLIPKLA
jgi:hypothetical protein